MKKTKLFFWLILILLLSPFYLQAQMVSGKLSKVGKVKPNYEWKTFVLNEVSAPIVTYNLRVGRVKRFGYYGAVKTNFSFKRDYDFYEYYSNPYYNDIFWSGDYYYSRFSITGGGIMRLSPSFMLYTGLGYGWKEMYATNLAEEVFQIGGYSDVGVDVEMGMMYSINRFVLSVGYNPFLSTSIPDDHSVNIGIGFIF